MKKISYMKFQKKNSGQFIARKGSKVLASGKTLGDLRKHMKEKRIPYTSDIVVGYVGPRGAVCVYSVSIPI